MRHLILPTLLLALCLEARVRAADAKAPGGPVFVLPEVGEKAPASRFSDAQVGYVQSWIRQLAPECPTAVAAAVAEDFLLELQQRHPDKLDRLLSTGFPASTHAPMLLRHLGAKLTGTAAPLRERVAGLRVAALLAGENPGSAPAAAEAADLLAKIRDASAVQHRRLLEGRLEDDELLVLLKKVQQPGRGETRVVTSAQPKVLTAADIVSEFVRHNITGAALPRLQAYTVEGRITGASDEGLDLLLFKMKPDRFRLVVRKDGKTVSILGADGDRFWQQQPGQPVQVAAARNMGPRRHLGEFIDPLFVGEGYQFERLPDGTEGDRKFHRISVRRADGSGYVAQIDAETFRVTGRENEDGSTARYSDFREVAGLTLAFREEAIDRTGRKTVLILSRITPNPGMIRDFFQPPGPTDFDSFQLEKFATTNPAATGLRK